MVLKEVTAQCDAANTHCLMACHQINALTTQLSNKSQRKQQKSKKTEAWVLTLPKLQGEFDARDTADEAKEKADFEKAAQKKADKTARMLHINEEIKSQVFDCPLTSYKWKDDLVALASALSLPISVAATWLRTGPASQSWLFCNSVNRTDPGKSCSSNDR